MAEDRDIFELPRNATGLKYQMIGAVIGVSIFWFFAIWLIRMPFELLGSEFLSRTLVTTSILCFILIGMVLGMQRSWRKRSYYLRGSMIVISQKSPWTGAVDESIYRLDTVVSANVKQSVLGKRNNFGDIILSAPKTGENGAIILKDIEKPRETVLKINNIVDKSGSHGIAMTN